MDQPGASIFESWMRSGTDLHFQLAFAVPMLLLAACMLILLLGRRVGGGAGIAVGAATAAAGAAFYVLFTAWVTTHNTQESTWFTVAGHPIKVGIVLDDLSIPMLAFVCVITLLVMVFSTAYMRRDPMRHRYWAYLCLFAAAMCGLVLASNLLLTFVCWELVGLASYLLIGFWHREAGPALGSFKAFVVNRMADAGFIMALMLIWQHVGSFSVDALMARDLDTATLLLIGGGLAVGALGKSAQFPFQVWLPDAMAGPTPVSSLLHAATMVAAGVFLLLRVAPILPPELLVVLAGIGAGTALIAAFSALAQTDIKRVLAYSTVSQLGFMVMGIGVGAAGFAFLHLLAHAFFKCGLFLVAGAVIHQQHAAQEASHAHFDAQDMRLMGGLRRKMPLVAITWAVFAASLAGLPLSSGFLSKDGILMGSVSFASSHGGYAWLIPGAATLASLLTAFYIARQGMLVFGGRNRAAGAGAPADFLQRFPRVDWRMAVPLVVLALGSTWVLFSPSNPFHLEGVADHASLEALPRAFAGLAVLGIVAALLRFRKGPLPYRLGFFGELSLQHFHFDALYQRLIIRPFLAFSRLMALVDHHVMDGAVRLVAGIVLRRGHRPGMQADDEGIPTGDRPSLSHAASWLDRNAIDRLVNGIAHAAMRAGRRLGGLQSGKLQSYLLYTVLGLLLLLLALIYIFTN